MYRILFNKWNLVASVVLVLIFSYGTYWIRQKMHRQSEEVSQSMIHGSTRGYQKFLNQYFDGYSQLLQQLDYIELNAARIESKQTGLNTVIRTDSTIVAVGLLDALGTWQIETSNQEIGREDLMSFLVIGDLDSKNTLVLHERYLFVGESVSEEGSPDKFILIDLYRLHQEFIDNNVYTSVYQIVLNDRQQCIYHPEIDKVGKHYFLPDFLFVGGHYNRKKLDTLHVVQSEYLQMSVFRRYSSLLFSGEEWLVLSVSPGFEVKDMIEEQERNMLLLFLLFIITLLGILVFGIVHWKREFLLRSSVEQENLSLLLKHEKQKSEAFSTKLELLRSGLNSHFMFNSLGTVKALLSKEDKVARGMLSDLSHLYRYQLRIEGEHMVTLQEELTFTQKYVDVINLRMNSSIKMEISNLPEYLDRKVLPISLQLLVENCIKHNVASECNPLVIYINVKDDRIYVINELRPKVAIVEMSGKGLKNLNTRYSLITKQECTFKEEGSRYIASIPLIR